MTALAWFGTLAAAFSAGALLLLALGALTTLVAYLRHRARALESEQALLSVPLVHDADLPHVLVQIPMYNEASVAARAVAAAARLDWPRDKLHVQALDDSDDGTTAVAGHAVELERARGIDARLLRRPTRQGFKGGNLAAGLAQSDAEFVAVFDADEVPPPEFLRIGIRPLLSDPGVAYVQGRREFYNAQRNWLTRAQALIQEIQYAVELPAKFWSGQPVTFNGSCGIWRRAAIDAAGGWSGATLTEDIDISYRAVLLGWRAVFLTRLSAQSELPERFDDWQRQQRRWSTGFAQVGLRLVPPLWRSRLSWRSKAGATLHLGGAALGPLIALELAGLLVVLASWGSWPTWLALLVAAGPAVGISAGLGLSLCAQRFLGKPADGRYWMALALFLVLLPYANARNAMSAWDAVGGRTLAFERTPKRGG